MSQEIVRSEGTQEKPRAFPENLPQGWRSLLAPEKDKPYFKSLTSFLAQEYASGQLIFPARENILRALQELDFEQVRVVILGQDPYHGADQAVGRSFAVPNDLRLKPPSLQNIGKEIQKDLGVSMEGKGSDLSGWAEQGVLLLNTVLTVRSGQAFSHRDKGWELFTDQVIRHLGTRDVPLVFVLWGAAAQKKKQLISNPKHFVLESAHPSPLSASRGFFGSRPFSKANAFLKQIGLPEIDWTRTVALASPQI